MMKYQNILIFPSSLHRYFHKTSMALSDFYSVLGINPKSTQAQIKEAYYKLSKLYHPDMNSDKEALKKFQEVNQAYEVLSDLKTKRLYDKGVIRGINEDIKREQTPEEKFYTSLEKKNKVPAYGKTTIYDFDKWTQEHYSNSFRSERNYKKNKELNKFISKTESKDEITLKLFVLFFMVTLMIAIYLDYQQPNFVKKREE